MKISSSPVWFHRSSLVALAFQLILLTFFKSGQVLARIGDLGPDPGSSDHELKKHRSLAVISSHVHRELRSLTSFNGLESGGFSSALQVPHAVNKIHRILVEGFGNEHDEVDSYAREGALEALRLGSAKWSEEIAMNVVNDNTDELHHSRRMRGSLGRNLEILDGLLDDLDPGFYLEVFWKILVFVVEFLVGTVIESGTGADVGRRLETNWLNVIAPAALIGIKGRQYGPIKPCNALPMSDDETYSYLPMLSDFFKDIRKNIQTEATRQTKQVVRDLIDNVKNLMDPSKSIGSYDKQCKKENEFCEDALDCCSANPQLQKPVCSDSTSTCGFIDNTLGKVDMTHCIMWSAASGGGIDTIGFKPKTPWPPILIPKKIVAGQVESVLPYKKSGSSKNKGCGFHNGIPVGTFTIKGVPFKVLTKFNGFALSWANPGKLAFSQGGYVWDGFREVPLPTIDGMNFWISFQFLIQPEWFWKIRKMICKGNKSKKLRKLKALSVTLDFNLYVSVAGSSTRGAQEERFDAFGGGGKVPYPTPSPSSSNIPSSVPSFSLLPSTSVEPSSVPSFSLLPSTSVEPSSVPSFSLLSSTSVEPSVVPSFSLLPSTSVEPSVVPPQPRCTRALNELGDECVIMTSSATLTLPALGTFQLGQSAGGYCKYQPQSSGARCYPSGFFMNVDVAVKFQPNIKKGKKGSVSRLITQLSNEITFTGVGNFGVFLDQNDDTEAVVFRLETPAMEFFGLSVTQGENIEFQYLKGSEVERRRKTILRQNGIANCPDVGNTCKNWANFNQDQDNTEICTDILLNQEIISYYNRILTADTQDESKKYLITPPEDSSFKTPHRFDFSNDLDANVVIIQLGSSGFMAIGGVIMVQEISGTLLLTDRTPPDVDFKNDADDAYSDLTAEEKTLFRQMNSYYFLNINQYTDYLSEQNETVIEIINDEIDEVSQDNMNIFIRLFTTINVLMFTDIELGFIVTNYADNVCRDKWAVVGQFETRSLGFIYSVSMETVFDFVVDDDESEDETVNGAGSIFAASPFDVQITTQCDTCEAVEQFFEEVGEAFADGVKAIGNIIKEDVANFAVEAVNAVEQAAGDLGKEFVSNIEQFGNTMSSIDFASPILNGIREIRFTEAIKDKYSELTKGQITLDDAVNAGLSLIDGAVSDVNDFLIDGITDLADALSDYLDNLIGSVTGCTDEYQVRFSRFTDPNDCKSNCLAFQTSEQSVEEACWCMDEYECPVKVAEKRKISRNFNPCASTKRWLGIDICVPGCTVEDTGWLTESNDIIRYNTRQFDKDCRTTAMEALATATKKHQKMIQRSQTIDRNFQDNFKGLNNFFERSESPDRRLQNSATNINSIAFTENIRVTNADGTLKSSVQATGKYNGAKLSANDINTPIRESDFDVDFNFSGFDQNEDIGTETLFDQLRRGAAEPFLGDLQTNDDTFFSRQPIVPSPKITLNGPLGTAENPVELACTGNLQTVWANKLGSSSPQDLRRRRTRELSHVGAFKTSLEYSAEFQLKEMIENNEININVELGAGVDDDVFGALRLLIDTKGAGAFMDPTTLNQRKLAAINIDEWRVDVISAIPTCTSLSWQFQVTAESVSGDSNPIIIHAYVAYGDTQINSAPSHIQTTCHDSEYGVEELEDNTGLRNLSGVTTFTPRVSADNCPAPYLDVVWESDVVVNDGVICTQNYKQIERTWRLTHHDDSHANCLVLPTSSFPNGNFVQTITLGGLPLSMDGPPDTPTFNVENHIYYLPNEPNATSPTDERDFLVDNELPYSALCGICNDDFADSVTYDHPDPFVCDEVGTNVVSITVVNNIGIEVTKTAIATVIDDKPPNVFNRIESLLEDGSYEDDVSTETWDNCYIKDYTLVNYVTRGELEDMVLPELEYFPNNNYFGPDSISYYVTDWKDNDSVQATLGFNVMPVNDAPYLYSLSHDKNTVQYSDEIVPVTILASDVDDTQLHVSSSFTKNSGTKQNGLPLGLSFNAFAGNCTMIGAGNDVTPGTFPWQDAYPNAFPSGSECRWILSGKTKVDEGVYNITITVTDEGGGTSNLLSDSSFIVITVLPEDSTILYDPLNPVAVKVKEDGGDSSPFVLKFKLAETLPDLVAETLPNLPAPVPLAGDLFGYAEASKQVVGRLVPVGPGGSVAPVVPCSRFSTETDNDDYASELYACNFDAVPVNTYSFEISVSGGFYKGFDEDVLTVFDPSLGFTTGGGWFFWPGTNEKTSFGYTMKYNTKGKKVNRAKGSVLVVRHVEDDKKYRVKSNALEGLSIGGVGTAFGWASFSGKCTYLDEEWLEPEGNHEFTVYVEDYGDDSPPRFWLETRDKVDDVVLANSLPDKATDNAVELQGGTIVVPH